MLKLLTFILLFAQVIGTGSYRKVFYVGLPPMQLQLKASILSAGPVVTWNDSSGNSNNVTFGGTPPVAGITDPTPGGKQSVVFAVSSPGALTSGISTSSAVSVCAYYHITTGGSGKQTFTSNNSGGGTAAYYGNNNSNGPQGLDESFIAVVATGIATPPSTWQSTCVSYAVGGAWVLYRNGTVDASGTSSTGLPVAINQVFSNNSSESFQSTVAELDVANIAWTSPQIAAIQSYYTATY
jgi:hypothetical protein